MTTVVKITEWNAGKVLAKNRQEMASRLNEAGAVGVSYAQMKAPRDTGFMANTIEVVERASEKDLRVRWGNVTALYTLWQEIGSQGRPGRYFLRQSLDYAGKQLMKAG